MLFHPRCLYYCIALLYFGCIISCWFASFLLIILFQPSHWTTLGRSLNTDLKMGGPNGFGRSYENPSKKPTRKTRNGKPQFFLSWVFCSSFQPIKGVNSCSSNSSSTSTSTTTDAAKAERSETGRQCSENRSFKDSSRPGILRVQILGIFEPWVFRYSVTAMNTYRLYNTGYIYIWDYYGWLFYPVIMGITINHDKDPYEPNSISWKVRPGFFRGSVGVSPLDQKRMQTLGLATVKTHDPFGPCSGQWTDQNGMYYHVALAGDVPWYPWEVGGMQKYTPWQFLKGLDPHL